jgi:BRCT domain type II-containing protein
VIDEARRFMGTYGLRPIGGTLQSDDEEEYDHRVAARDARRALNDIRLDEQPDPALVRKALRPRAAAIVADKPTTAKSSSTSRSASSNSASSTSRRTSAAAAATTSVDLDEIQSRALALLDQLSAIDAQLALVAEQSGLAARARRSDLEKQKATVLRTLAALEKARLSAAK